MSHKIHEADMPSPEAEGSVEASRRRTKAREPESDPVRQRASSFQRWTFRIIVTAIGIALAAAGFQQYKAHQQQQPAAHHGQENPLGHAERIGPDTLELPPDVVRSLGVQTAAAVPVKESRRLAPLHGSLALDPEHIARVRARFAGEVIDPTEESISQSEIPMVSFGDHVTKGQLLAVLWSKDLGEKKSELVDAISQLRVNRDTLNRLKELSQGVVAQKQVREAERAVEGSMVAVARAEATLRTWRVGQDEIDAVTAEAERLGVQEKRADPRTVRRWARVEVRAPLTGTVLEKNVAIGDMADTNTDLFKIADVSRLCVWAYVYEEDLPGLLALPKPTPWKVQLKADAHAAPLAGAIERVGELIDPNQHTALVLGHVDNPEGKMRAGQFVTATIVEPPPADEVEIPTTALVEDGNESIVLVQENPARPDYSLRHVAVTARYQDVVHLRGAHREDSHATDGVAAGEQVVVAAAVELRAALKDLRITPQNN